MRTATARPIHVIASDIRAEWKKVYFGAVPYLEAMEELKEVTDMYYADSADSIIRYFLSNASTFRGPRAKEIKAELKALI
ncbi:hypothetical protein SAMN05216275_10544 [Streptosporangium canum]|uniref:Uncharacterized protein n=1 Tax=Streptosporangium canum TaxID=324952 RepID=A0A1I3L8L1_9ACTN|nr:hypothetical protein [Streptosporangium canum]SFI80846.1 hypothetical protein SAMN05216275_10544 [Streptosporangium canum]